MVMSKWIRKDLVHDHPIEPVIMKLPVLETNLMQMVLVIFGICPEHVCLGWCYHNDPNFNSFYFGLMKSHGGWQPQTQRARRRRRLRISRKRWVFLVWAAAPLMWHLRFLGLLVFFLHVKLHYILGKLGAWCTRKPTIFLNGCLVISNLFLGVMSWNPPVETTIKEVVVWSSRWTWWWFQIFFMFIPKIGEELWTHFDDLRIFLRMGWWKNHRCQLNMVVSTMFDAIGISSPRRFPSCT